MCAYVNAYSHLETCVLMSMLGGGTASYNLYVFLNHECVCLCQCLEVVQPQSYLETCVRLPMSMLGGGGPSWDYKRKACSFLKGHCSSKQIITPLLIRRSILIQMSSEST